MRVSLWRWVVRVSSLRSRVLVSKRVRAVVEGFFFHRIWVVELKGPKNGIGG